MHGKVLIFVALFSTASGLMLATQAQAWPWTTKRNVFGYIDIKGSSLATMDKLVRKVIVTGDDGFRGEYTPGSFQTKTVRWFVNDLPVDKRYTATAYVSGMNNTNARQASVTFTVTKPTFGDDQQAPRITINY